MIKIFVTDCDGVLTDGGMYYTENGDVMKKFNTKDGMAFQLLKQSGIVVAIITGENSDIVKRRAEKLSVTEVYLGEKDKQRKLFEICKKYEFDLSECAYIGDDINDLECIKMSGLSGCPADAVSQVRCVAKYICEAKGGEGAVREFAEYVMYMNENKCIDQ